MTQDTQSWSTQTNTNLVSRDEARGRILTLAREQGISGPFKVFYKNAEGNYDMVSDPNSLPEQVDMTMVRVSAVLDQA